MNIIKHPATYHPHSASSLASGGEPPHDDGMEARVAKLEDAMIDVRERLTRIETRLESTATNAALERMGRLLIQWFVGTAVALAAIAFAVAKIVH